MKIARRSDLYSLHKFQIQFLINFSLDESAKWRITKFRMMISNALEDFPDSPQFLSMWLAVESQTVGIQKQSSLKISKNRYGSPKMYVHQRWTSAEPGLNRKKSAETAVFDFI